MNLEGIQILLVEYDAGETQRLTQLIRDTGGGRLRLQSATAPEPAIERLGQGGIDVLLLDLALADGQGWAALASLHSRAPGVPIVVLTSPGEEGLAAKAMRAGAQDYL